MLYVRLTIKVKVGIPESFKVGWYPQKITGSSHLKKIKGFVSKYCNISKPLEGFLPYSLYHGRGINLRVRPGVN